LETPLLSAGFSLTRDKFNVPNRLPRLKLFKCGCVRLSGCGVFSFKPSNDETRRGYFSERVAPIGCLPNRLVEGLR
jgi:hypothetical protein